MKLTEAKELLTGRYKDSRKIANNTYLTRLESGGVAIKLHSTNILTIDESDTVTVETGGWQTVTTKARLNEYLPDGFRIYQERGQWYWETPKENRVPFTKGDKITAAGKLVSLATGAPVAERKALAS